MENLVLQMKYNRIELLGFNGREKLVFVVESCLGLWVYLL